MKRISSRMTWVFKWLAPACGLLLLLVCAGVQLFDAPPNPAVAIMVLILGGPVWWAIWNVSRRLADSVDDLGDHLVVRKGRREVRVWLRDISSIPGAPLAPNSPRRLRVRLRSPGELGNEFEFLVPLGGRSGPEPVSESLNRRLANFSGNLNP